MNQAYRKKYISTIVLRLYEKLTSPKFPLFKKLGVFSFSRNLCEGVIWRSNCCSNSRLLRTNSKTALIWNGSRGYHHFPPTHAHTHTYTHSHTHSHTLTHTHLHPLHLSHITTHALARTHSLTQKNTHTLSLKRTHPHLLTRTHIVQKIISDQTQKRNKLIHDQTCFNSITKMNFMTTLSYASKLFSSVFRFVTIFFS